LKRRHPIRLPAPSGPFALRGRPWGLVETFQPTPTTFDLLIEGLDVAAVVDDEVRHGEAIFA